MGKEIIYHEGNNPFADRVDPDGTKWYEPTAPGFEMGAQDKYMVYWPIPRNMEEAKEFWGPNMTEREVFLAVVKAFRVLPAYKVVGFYNIGDRDPNGITIHFIDQDGNDQTTTKGDAIVPLERPNVATARDENENPITNSEYYSKLKPGGHEAMQELATNFELKPVGESKAVEKATLKSKAKALDEAKAAAGISSQDELIKMLEAAKKAMEAGLITI